MIRFGCHLGSFSAPKRHPIAEEDSTFEGLEVDFLGHVIFVTFGSPLRRPKRCPRGSKTPPRGSKRPPKALQEAPRGPPQTPRAGQEDSRLFKIAPRGSQKTPRTLKIAKVDVSQRPCPKSQNEKRRAGGGDPPWGRQSAARPLCGAEQGVPDPQPQSPPSSNPPTSFS